MEYEKCYVFGAEDTRPAKRRKFEPQGLQASWKIRKEAYPKAWREQQTRIGARLNAINATTIAELSAFLEDALSAPPAEGIPTAIISTGTDASSHVNVTGKLSDIATAHGRRRFVWISASLGTNLKALLKSIIQMATARNVTTDGEDDEHTTTKRGTRLLNYDLQILSDYVEDHKVTQVVLAFEDTEAFDSNLLSELIELLACWHDRIPFVFLLNIATSVDFLQQRLSKGAVKSLRGRLFDVAPSFEAIEQVFEAITDPETPLWIGSGLMSTFLDRQNDYIQSIDSFTESVQYAYMSCYYANALSIFLDIAVRFKEVPTDHFEAIRNVESFRTFCQRLLANNEVARLRAMLENDEMLLGFVKQSIQQGRQILADIGVAIEVVRQLQGHLPGQQMGTKSKLYIQAMSNKLNDSSLVRSLLLAARKAPSSVATDVVNAVISLDLPDDIKGRCAVLRRELSTLVKDQDGSGNILRSEDDVRNSTLRTTVVAQKVELSKQKATLSKQDAAYTAILRRFTNTIEEFFANTLIDPKSLIFHEIFLYDLKSPHREILTPRPRHAIERALAAPHDYLACECCTPRQGENDESTLSASQPATAVLYQLYLESGSLVNASDLFQAFQAVLGEEKSAEEQMALFQRALAELRYLGLVKSTKKRVDHVAKVAWRGL